MFGADYVTSAGTEGIQFGRQIRGGITLPLISSFLDQLGLLPFISRISTELHFTSIYMQGDGKDKERREEIQKPKLWISNESEKERPTTDIERVRGRKIQGEEMDSG